MTFQEILGWSHWPVSKAIDKLNLSEDRQIKIICDVLPWLRDNARSFYVQWVKKAMHYNIESDKATQSAIKNYILHNHTYDAIDISRIVYAFQFYLREHDRTTM